LNNNGKNVTVGSVTGSAQLDGSGTWTLGGNDKDFTFNGSVNKGKLAKTGSGIMTLSKVQSSIGGTVSVNEGTLNLNSALVTLKDANRLFGAYGVSVANGGTLAGRGVLAKIDVNNGGVLAPGSATSTTRYSALRTMSGIYLYDGAKAEFLINNGKNADNSRTYLVTNGTLSLASGSTITVTLKSTYTPAAGDSCTLWTAADFSGSADNVTLNLPTLPTGLSWDTSELFQATGKLKVISSTGIRNLTADEIFTGQLYDMSGKSYGIIKTSKAAAAQDLRKQGLTQGVYIIRVGGDSMKVIVK
jgi:autotransporter-associated beta strand protein